MGRAKAFEGTTIRRSSTALGLNGYKPHFLNPLMMFSNVNDKGQAAQTSEAKSSVVITRPGLSEIYLEQALEKLDLNDLNTPTSSGCSM